MENKWLEKTIESMQQHLEILNQEHGETRDKVTAQGEIIKNLCECFVRLDTRVWTLVVGTILGFIITIFLLILNIYLRK